MASGVAIQAKGLLYRLRPDKGRDAQKDGDYKLAELPGMDAGLSGGEAAYPINKTEDAWTGSGDYWLGRRVLTDLSVNVPGEGVLLMNDVTMGVSMQKEVVRTAIVGRPGTVKEYVTDGDYQVTLTVGLVAVDSEGRETDQYPERAVAQLREILERPEALEVGSGFLDLFGITHLVVTGWTVKQQTHSNRQTVEIQAVSDREYVIEGEEY